ncbi:hypothetical protein OSB04_017636 [Centaurea solstitialis]|uniref:Uncharacterized protein n=1 Tax=Centaurea solstitialis TaxID=347529 RepID=A0AA38TGF7_9ASTR|nr:hypothetical protein OSB04_017636 [Centaurea solstitialis]
MVENVDKSWMNLSRFEEKYILGIYAFLEFAKRNSVSCNGYYKCLCTDCGNMLYQNEADIIYHLKNVGIMKNYIVWDQHGEFTGIPTARQQRLNMIRDRASSSRDVNPVVNFVEDAFLFRERYNDNKSVAQEGTPVFDVDDVASKVIDAYSRLLAETNTPLYGGCEQSSLGSLLRAISLKKKLELLSRQGDIHNQCPICGLPGYEDVGNKIPMKTVRYLPLTLRLQRLYMSKYTANHMRWHGQRETSPHDDVLRHPADGEAWKNFDRSYPQFASDIRNVRLALSTDGFSPFGASATPYTIAFGNMGMVTRMVGWDVELVNIFVAGGYPPLFRSVEQGRCETLRYLYKQFQNLNDIEFWRDDNRKVWLLKQCIKYDVFDVAIRIVTSHPQVIKSPSVVGAVLGALAQKLDAFKRDCTCITLDANDDDEWRLLKLIWRRKIMRMSADEVFNILKGLADNQSVDIYPSNILFDATEMGNTFFVVEPMISWCIKIIESSQANFIARLLYPGDANKINQVLERLKTARDRQKSYADKRRKDIEFQVGDLIMLKVSPWKGVIRFGKKGKLSPRFIGPYKITERVGAMAYKLELPVELSGVHNTFHVSNLRKCLADAEAAIPLQDIKVDQKLNFVEEPVAVMDRKVRKLRYKEISLVKIQWKFHKGQEATWEAESEMRAKKELSSSSGFIISIISSSSDNIDERYFNICIPLYEASLIGDWDSAYAIFVQNGDYVRYAIDMDYSTPLHIVAYAQETKRMNDFVQKLLNLMTHLDLRLQNRHSSNAFVLAAAFGNIGIVKRMVGRDPGLVNIPGAGGYPPLFRSAEQERCETLRYLYEKIQDLDDIEFWRDDNRKVWLLKQCIKYDVFDCTRTTRDADDDDACRLLKIIWRNNIVRMTADEVFNILKGPADQSVDIYPSKILFDATEMGNTFFVVELLRAHPALIWSKNADRQTLLHEVEEMMLPNFREIKNNEGQTAYEIFSEHNEDVISQAFTVPGGYSQERGTPTVQSGGGNQEAGIPIFIHKPSFLVFVIADAISLSSASTSLLVFLSDRTCFRMSRNPGVKEKERERLFQIRR